MNVAFIKLINAFKFNRNPKQKLSNECEAACAKLNLYYAEMFLIKTYECHWSVINSGENKLCNNGRYLKHAAPKNNTYQNLYPFHGSLAIVTNTKPLRNLLLLRSLSYYVPKW